MNKLEPLGGHGPDARSQWASAARTAHFLPNTHSHIDSKLLQFAQTNWAQGESKSCADRSGAWRPAHSAVGASPALDVNAARRVAQVRGDAFTFSLARNELTSEAWVQKQRCVGCKSAAVPVHVEIYASRAPAMHAPDDPLSCGLCSRLRENLQQLAHV